MRRALAETCIAPDCQRPCHARDLCNTHYSRLVTRGSIEPPKRPTEAERFWAKVNKTDAGCWLWTGAKSALGYGKFRRAGGRSGKTIGAHRFSYMLAFGPIPDGLEIDHVRARGCVHTACVNPAHLEAVTQRENNDRSNSFAAVNSRKTECKYGHPFTPENTVWRANGTQRQCIACLRRLHAQRVR